MKPTSYIGDNNVTDFQRNSFDRTTGYLATPSEEFCKVKPDAIPGAVLTGDVDFDPDSVRDSTLSIPNKPFKRTLVTVLLLGVLSIKMLKLTMGWVTVINIATLES